MAASLYAVGAHVVATCCRSARGPNTSLVQLTRWYARGIKRVPNAVKTPEDDLRKLTTKGRPIAAKDPKLNPFLPFITGDPIQNQLTDRRDLRRQPGVKQSVNLSSSKKHLNNHSQNSAALSKSASKTITSSGLRYEKLEDGDKRFGHEVMAAKSWKEREKKGLILLEGRRLILDSLHAGAHLKYLYFSDLSLVSGLPKELLEDAALYKVQYRHLKLWASTQTPSGIMGLFVKPDLGEVLCPQSNTVSVTLICDNVRDPGNMGTIIRTAAAAGCKKIITSKGCVDVWHPKVLRGAMGGHFYTCIQDSLPWEQIVNHVSRSSSVLIADTRTSSNFAKSFDVTHPKVIDLLSTGDSDSISSTDTETTDEEDEESEDSEDTDSSWSDEASKLYTNIPLSVVQYSDLDCSGSEEVVVIVGGETAGVSPQAKKLAFDMYGQYVTIPMVEAMDSLNTAVAAAVVLYEVRRQLCVNAKSDKGK